MKEVPLDQKNLRKNFIWNLIGTGLNSCTSLFFLIIVTRINDVDNAGIFSLGFSLACMLFYIGIYCGRVFQVTENPKISDKSFMIARIISTVLMIVVSVIYLLTKNYDSFKFAAILLLCLYKTIEAFAEVIYGYFQKYDELYISGISLTLKTIFSLIAFILVDQLTKNMLLAIFSMIIVNILVLIFYDFIKMKKYHIWRSKVDKKDLLSIFKNGFYPFALSFLALLVINSPKYAIDNFLSNDMQTYFGIIIMPATVVSLAAQFIIYPFLTSITNFIKKKAYHEISKLTLKIISVVAIIGVICTILAFAVGTPLLELVYGVELSSYRGLLTLIMLGATFNACVYILFNILISLRKLRLQTIIYALVAIFSYITAQVFVSNFSISGACYSYILSMFILLIAYSLLMIYTIKNLSRKNPHEHSLRSKR